LQRLITIEKEIKKSTTLRLNTLDQEILEIRKVLNDKLGKPFPEFSVIQQEQEEEPVQQPDGSEQQPADIERAEQDVKLDFTCSSCSVTKPIDQREKRKTKFKCL